MQRPIMDALHKTECRRNWSISTPPSPFNLYVKVAAGRLVCGLSVRSLPGVVVHLAGPLPQREALRAAVHVFDGGLFLAGGSFGYKLVYPQALEFLIDFGKQFQPMITVREYTDLFLTIIIGMGLVFELPILVFFWR